MRQMLYYVHLQLNAPWKIFRLFLSSVYIFFSKSTFSEKKSGIEYDQSQNSLDPDQHRHSDGPRLGPNDSQKLSADNTRRQRDN